MSDTVIFDKLYSLFFGEEAQEWAQADEAGRAAMLDGSGLSDLTPEDLHEAVTLMSQELPAEQAALLSPVTTVGNQTPVTSTSAADVSGPEVTQVIEGDTNVAGGNIGTTSAPDPAPAPAPAPAAHAHSAPPPPPAYEGEPAEVLEQTINYYVTNVTNNVDESVTNIDESTNIDNSVELEGDIYAEGDVDLDFDNDVQTGGDGAVILGEDAQIRDSQIASGDGAVAAGGSVEDVITGDVTDSTVVQGDVSDSTVTGDVEGVVNTGSGDVTGVNTGEVGGDMVTNTGDGNVATGGSEVNDLDLDTGGGDAQVTQGDGNISAQGSDAQAAGGDAIDAEGNVNTGAGDQTNVDIGDISSGDDLNLNLGGDQNVQDTETNTEIVNDNDTEITTDIETNTDIEANTDVYVDESEETYIEDSIVDSEGAAQADNGDALGVNDSDLNTEIAVEEIAAELPDH